MQVTLLNIRNLEIAQKRIELRKETLQSLYFSPHIIEIEKPRMIRKMRKMLNEWVVDKLKQCLCRKTGEEVAILQIRV